MKEQQRRFYEVVSLMGAILAAFSLVFMASIAVSGQTISLPSSSNDDTSGDSLHGITFPVVELGNCANKNECKDYCNQPANMDACIAFAKDHGLMTATDATRAGKFGKLVRAGNGPGGCDSPQSCDTYCSNISHLDECTAFAEKNGFKDEHYAQGKKIQAFLKNGGTTPGNCQTKEECQTYCGDFSHAKECFDFAQKAGIMRKDDKGSPSGNSHEPNAEQLSKIMELSQNGETPGHCASKDECEKYCTDASHREECVDFGVKIGFIKPDEASKIKQMGGKGPGDCNSPDSCRAYCDDQSHHEECFTFAEEHGFMTHDESQQAKDGMVRAHMGFENAPSQVQECLKTTLGASILEDIQSGKLVPGPDISGQVRGCFEKFGGNGRPQEVFKNIPPEVTVCLKEKFGVDFDKIRIGKASTTPEMANSFRECFRGMQMNATGRPPMGGEGTTTQGRRNPFGGQENEGNSGKPPVQDIQNMLRSAPPEVVACIKEKFPDGFPTNGTGDPAVIPEIKDKIRGCFESFRPAMKAPMPGTTSTEGAGGNMGQEMTKPQFAGQLPTLPPGGLANMPPELLACIRETIGEENFQKIQTAPPSLEIIGVVRTCIEKMSKSPAQTVVPPPALIPKDGTSAPMTFLEKLIGAVLLPARWILGK